ncbi:hypothetical protein GCM10027598_01730 [Amycolatopsis oliviviridis]|uniref:Uncharacterized protein n=1 Tax=Amycolatopsis oliviviridis TaxID=1471590 RepID=A0ABQ3LPA4_9PSEU|nr:hypothetical protein [Amycolatopsis oliviviridis]GHH22419.1 hypothetical protein GCM10017790_44150 [Amycolatopsis oliviviridis]
MIVEDEDRTRPRRGTVLLLAAAALLAVTGYAAAPGQASASDGDVNWNNTISAPPPPVAAG